MAAFVPRSEWNFRAAVVIAAAVCAAFFVGAPAQAQDEEEESAVTPMQGCAEREQPDASMMERLRRRLTVTTCASSA